MTATVPQQGPPTTGGPTAVRLDARPGAVYGYDVRDHHTGVVRPCDYVGQSRVPELRDRQHRGLAAQRDGQVREQPWADLIVGPMRILETGVWTDAELDAAELKWMARCGSRLNCRDNDRPDRIPIYEQRRQRDERDVAKGLAPRDWGRQATPVRTAQPAAFTARPSMWRRLIASRVVRWAGRKVRTAARRTAPWLAAWVALTVAAWIWAPIPAGDAPTVAAVTTLACAVAWASRTKPRRRRRANRRRSR